MGGSRILVTGGAGYIGSHTVRMLQESGYEVVVFDNLSAGHIEAISQAQLIVGDLKDGPSLQKAMKGCDAVIHFAAHCSVPESVADPAKYYDNNVVASVELLNAMLEADARKIVFSSSAAVYGNPMQIPISEDHPTIPINPYGRSKRFFEEILEDARKAYGIGYVCLRYFNAAGAHPSGEIGEDHTPETHLIPNILRSVMNKSAVFQLFGTNYPTRDGTCVRDYIHVADLADAHIKALEALQAGNGHIYNVGTGHGWTVREVMKTCERVTGGKITMEERPPRPGDPPELVADSSKIKRELGWTPQHERIEDIVETAWKWHKGHPNGFAGEEKD